MANRFTDTRASPNLPKWTFPATNNCSTWPGPVMVSGHRHNPILFGGFDYHLIFSLDVVTQLKRIKLMGNRARTAAPVSWLAALYVLSLEMGSVHSLDVDRLIFRVHPATLDVPSCITTCWLLARRRILRLNDFAQLPIRLSSSYLGSSDVATTSEWHAWASEIIKLIPSPRCQRPGVCNNWTGIFGMHFDWKQ